MANIKSAQVLSCVVRWIGAGEYVCPVVIRSTVSGYMFYLLGVHQSVNASCLMLDLLHAIC